MVRMCTCTYTHIMTPVSLSLPYLLLLTPAQVPAMSSFPFATSGASPCHLSKHSPTSTSSQVKQIGMWQVKTPYTVVSTHKQCFHHKLGAKPVKKTQTVFPQNPRLRGNHVGPSPQHESRPPREQLLLQPLTAEGPRGLALSLEKPPPCDSLSLLSWYWWLA